MSINGINCNLVNKDSYNKNFQSVSFKAVSGTFLDEAARIAAIKRDLQLCYQEEGKTKSDMEIHEEAKRISDFSYKKFELIIASARKIPEEIFDLHLDIDRLSNKEQSCLEINCFADNKKWSNLFLIKMLSLNDESKCNYVIGDVRKFIKEKRVMWKYLQKL